MNANATRNYQLPPINDDNDLLSLVASLASDQLVIHNAAITAKATVEAAKKAYEEAVLEYKQRLEVGFEAITAYCAKHKDRLFPLKGKKRQKTYQVLQHKLQFRSSSEVSAPDDIITRIQNRLADLTLQSRSLTVPADLDAIEAEIELLNSLIRIPPPELNKDAAGEALKQEPNTLTLAPLGLSRVTSEIFKLQFAFTPED